MDEAKKMLVLELAGREMLRLCIGLVSQEVYCAGWYSGIEYDVWAYVTGHRKSFTVPECIASPTFQQDILDLANAVGGWWRWSQDETRAVFTPMDEWLEMFAFTHEVTEEPVFVPARVWNA